jgi:hypothetical protein
MELVKLPNGLFICQNHLRGSLRDKLKGNEIEK